MDTIAYVGLDVHKATVSVALAESGGGEILAARLAKGGRPAELLLRSWFLRLGPASAADRLGP
jgi:hypothetical protein